MLGCDRSHRRKDIYGIVSSLRDTIAEGGGAGDTGFADSSDEGVPCGRSWALSEHIDGADISVGVGIVH